MGPAAVLSILVRANTAQAQAALARYQAELKGTAATSESAAATSAATWNKAGSRMSSIGKTLTTHVALPAAAVGAAAVKMSLDFHESMRLVQTQAGESAKNVEMLSKSVQDFASSGQTQYGPQELAKALYEVESAGIHGAHAMDVLKKSSELAMVGQADLEATTKALTAAQNTHIKGSKNLNSMIGTLNATVGAGQMRMNDLVSAMGTGFLISARNMGLSLSDVGAALAELTKQGMGAEEASTRLRMALTQMATISTRQGASSAIESIGLGASQLSKVMRSQGLLPALQLLQKHLEGINATQRTNVLSQAFGGARSGAAIMALVGNTSDLSKTLDQVHHNADQVGSSFAAIKTDPSVQLHIIWAQIQASMVKIGTSLIPVVKDFAGVVEKIASAFAAMPSFARDFLIGAIVLGPMIRMVGLVAGLVGQYKALAVAAEAAAAAETAAGTAGVAGAAGSTAAGGAAAADMFGINAARTAAAGTTAAEAGGTAAEAGGLLSRAMPFARVAGKVALPVAIVVTGLDVASSVNKVLSINKNANSADLRVRLAAREQQHAPGGAVGAGLADLSGKLTQGLGNSGSWMKPSSWFSAFGMGGDSERQRTERDLLTFINRVRDGNLKIGAAQEANTRKLAAQAQRWGDISKAQRHAIDEAAKHASGGALDQQLGFKQARLSASEFASNFAAGLKNNKGNVAKAAHDMAHTAVFEMQGMSEPARRAAAKADVAMAAALVAEGKMPKAALTTLIGDLNKKWPGIVDPAVGNTKKLVKGVTGALSGLGAAVSHPLATVENMVQGFLGGLHLGSINFGSIIKAGQNAISSIGNMVGLGGGKGSQTGAVFKVPGSTSGDSYPVHAVLEPGEIFGVFNREAAPYVDAMNSMFPRFAQGGTVGPNPLVAAGTAAINLEETVAKAVIKAAGGGPKVQRMIAFGNEQSAKHMPYVYGGGHGSFNGPYDCSGFVSAILHAGGLVSSPMTTDGLKSWGSPGPGRSVTVGVRGSTGRSAHTMMEVGSGSSQHFFESGGSGGGAHTDSGWDGAFPIKRHPKGMQLGGVIRRAADMNLPLDLFDPQSPRFVGWGLKHGGILRAAKGAVAHWTRVGATYEGLDGHLGSSGQRVGGTNFAELLVAGANAGKWHQDLAATLGLPNRAGQGMPDGTRLYFRKPGSSHTVAATKNDIGSGQSSTHYKVDAQTGLLRALGLSRGSHDLLVSTSAGGATTPTATATGKGAKTASTGLTNAQIKQLPIPEASQKALMDALKNQDTLSAQADIYADFAQRATDLGVSIAGLSNTDWLNKQLSELAKLRNKLVAAHNLLVAAIEKVNEQIAKLGKKAANKKKVAALTTLQQAATAQLNTVNSALSDVEGNVADPSLTFAPMADLASAPLGTWGGKIGDVIQALHPDVSGASGSDATTALTDALNAQALSTIQQDYTALQQAPIFDQLPQLITGASGNPFLGGYADGGRISRQGFALVGERGPEVAKFPVGTSIGNLAPARGGGPGAPHVRVEVHGDVHTDGRPLEDAIKVHVNSELARQVSIRRRSRG